MEQHCYLVEVDPRCGEGDGRSMGKGVGHSKVGERQLELNEVIEKEMC